MGLADNLRYGFFYLVAHYYLKKPDQLPFIYTRYSSWKSIYKNIVNQIYYLLKIDSAPYITSVQFEVTNYCNLKCPMCPVNNGMKRKKGIMEWKLFEKIVRENPDMEFGLMFNWGETLLNKNIHKMVKYLSERKIRTFYTTNASIMTEEAMDKIIESGLTRITISMDGFGKTYEKIRGQSYNLIKSRILKLISKRNIAKIPMKIDVNMVIMDETEKEVKKFFRFWKNKVDRLQIQPKIDFENMPERPRTKRCKEFYRGNAVVLWNGDVTFCCVDYEGEMVIGNAYKQSLKNIWNSKKARKLRKLHNSGKFTSVCKNCNEFETEYSTKRFE